MTTDQAAETPTAASPAPATPAAATPASMAPSPAPAPDVTTTLVQDPTTPSPSATPVVVPAAPGADAVNPWGEDLDDELKAFAKDKTPAQVLKELKGAQALIGKKAIGIPGPNATPEEHRAFHEARGVPADASGYDLSDVIAEIATANPDWPRDEAREQQFKELAKSANLSVGEAKELVRKQLSQELEANKGQIVAQKQANTATETMIAENWGANREAKTAAANRFAHHLGIDGDVMEVFMKAAGTRPEARFKLLDLMAEQGKSLEEGAGPGGFNPKPGGMSSEQAAAAKEQFLNTGDNRNAYLDPGHKNHELVTKQVTQYLKVERGIQ